MTTAAPGLDLAVTVRSAQGRPESGQGRPVSTTDRPVLWLHGYTMDSTLWAPVWDRLPDHVHIGVDLPGHGDSPAIPPGLTLPALAAEVAHIAAIHGATRVVALCFGSCVALQWAMAAPDSITALVVAAPTLAGVMDEPAAQRRYRELSMLRRFVGPGEQMAGLWMSSPPNIFLGVQQRPDRADAVRDVLVRHRFDELLDGSMGRLSGGARPSGAELAQITAPTRVFVGDQDLATMLTNAALLGATLPDVRVSTMPGFGHLPPLEDPAAFALLVADHLR